MYRLAVTLRYFRKKRATLFAVAGIALGVMTLIVVMAVMHGYARMLRSVYRSVLADVVVDGDSARGFDDYEHIASQLEATDLVIAASPRTSSRGLVGVAADDRLLLKPAAFVGVDPEREAKVNAFRESVKGADDTAWLLDGETDMPAVAVGRVLASELSIERGDRVKLIAFDLDSFRPRDMYCRVTAVFDSGIYTHDEMMVYMRLRDAQKLGGLAGRATRLSLALDPRQVRAVWRQLREPPGFLLAAGRGMHAVLFGADDLDARKAASIEILTMLPRNGPRFSVAPWEALEQATLDVIEKEAAMLAVLLFLLLVIAGFSTIAILSLISRQKAKDIAVLKAIGASRFGIFRIFVGYGFVIGTAGALAGLAGGLVLEANIESVQNVVGFLVGFDPFEESLYRFKSLPADVNWPTTIATCLAAIFVSVAASLYPAMRASRLDPVAALRSE